MYTFSLPQLHTSAGSAEQARQLRSYLYQLTEQLQYALSNIGEENLSEELRQQYAGAKWRSEKVNAIAQRTDANSIKGETLANGLADTEKTLREQYEELLTEMQTRADAIEKAYQSEIETAADQITSTVSETYTLKTETETLAGVVESNLKQTAEALMAVFESAYDFQDADDLHAFSQAFRTYIRFSADGIEIGKDDSRIVAKLQNDRLSFVQPGSTDYEVAYISEKKLYITEAQILKLLTFGTDAHNRLFDLKIDLETGLTLTSRVSAG